MGPLASYNISLFHPRFLYSFRYLRNASTIMKTDMVYNLLRYFILILNQLLFPTVQLTYYLFCHPLKKSINKVDIFSTARKNSTCADAQETKFRLFFTEQKVIIPKERKSIQQRITRLRLVILLKETETLIQSDYCIPPSSLSTMQNITKLLICIISHIESYLKLHHAI